MGGVQHFEIHCGDVDRAMDFYGKVLGWSFQKWGEREYYLIDGDGIGAGRPTGALMPRATPAAASDHTAPNSTVSVFSVDSIDTAHADALSSGGTEERPISEIPDLGRASYCYDTEGNVFGMIQLY
ncbi:VOC family protein [Cognatiyoonia sp. IB215182]|uniref:VOC family protein n=1 Tax=Cognatiyoonia sp. IB215182 TaxID=3097353 RepID=UPI002A11FE40|nr:VOC family protein [Cognatiyoonia sp. IB215182]MDX8352203.1 VOC family protein [Cognatiyoonia sp. IB215182]